MADKRLIKVPLTEIRTNDEEVIGSLYPHKGKIYRWVKNAGDTALQVAAACLTLPTSVVDAANARVVSPSSAGPATAASASVLAAAGVPMAAIAVSGSDTGDHGWIQVKGVMKVNMTQSATAADQLVGAMAIPTDASDAVWGRAVSLGGASRLATTSVPEYLASKKVVMMQLHATTGAATEFTAVVDVQCL